MQPKREPMELAEYRALCNAPLFLKLVHNLRIERQICADSVCSGGTLRGECGATAESTARKVGMIQGLDMFLNYERMLPKEESKPVKK